MASQSRTLDAAARDSRILVLRSQGLTQPVIALRLGVSVALVNKVLRNQVRPKDRTSC